MWSGMWVVPGKGPMCTAGIKIYWMEDFLGGWGLGL